MARNVNTTIVPIVKLHILIQYRDGTSEEKILKVEDTVENLRYASGGKNCSISGRVADIGVNILKSNRLYLNITTARSYTKLDILPTTITIDSSTENHAALTEIPVQDILEGGCIIKEGLTIAKKAEDTKSEEKPVAPVPGSTPIQTLSVVQEGNVTDKEVKKIDWYMSYGMICTVLRSDDSINEFYIEEGDVLTNLKYMFKGDEEVLPNSKLIAIKRDGTKLTPTTLVLNLENKLRQIPVEQLIDIETIGHAISEGTKLSDTIKKEMDKVEPGEPVVIYTEAGTFKEDLTISGNVTIYGNKAGVLATSKNRDKVNLEDETIINGAIKTAKATTKAATVPVSSYSTRTLAADSTEEPHIKVEIDGCTLTGASVITLANACDEVIIRNCIVKDLMYPGTRGWFIGGASSRAVKVVVENCYFGKNPGDTSHVIYNFFEMQFKVGNGTSICGNYFEKGIGTHNVINFYDVEDNAIINIDDNIFEYAGVALRVGTKGDAHCDINITNITYYEQDPDPGWEGFMLIQGYTNLTKDMSNVRIYINKINRGNLTGAYYVLFSQYKDDFFILDEKNAPLVYIDGKPQPRLFNHIEYEKDKWLKEQEEKNKGDKDNQEGNCNCDCDCEKCHPMQGDQPADDKSSDSGQDSESKDESGSEGDSDSGDNNGDGNGEGEGGSEEEKENGNGTSTGTENSQNEQSAESSSSTNGTEETSS